MHSLFRKLSLLILPVIPFATARAALDPAVIGADARWMVYLDLNALRESALGQEMTEAFAKMQPPDVAGGLRLDLQKLLAIAGSATAYGTNLTKDPNAIDGALILQGTPELRTIAEGLVAQMTVSHPDQLAELTGMPFEAYQMSSGIAIAFPPEPIILVSKSKEQLVKARDVILGARPSLAKNPSRLSALLPKAGGDYLTAATIVPSAEGLFDENEPQARILQMASSGSVSLGEEGDMTSALVQLVASSGAMADKLSKIVQGLAAMASLAETDNEQLNKFLQSVVVGRVENTVRLQLAYPTARLVEMIGRMNGEHPHQDTTADGAQPHDGAPFPDPADGAVLAQWTADKQLPGDGPTPENLATHPIEGIALTRGNVVVLSGMRHDGENGRIDFVEFTSLEGSLPPLRYEAEYMRLKNYRTESAPFASGGELAIITENQGSVRFQFQGATGRYKAVVGYVDESDGESRYALSIEEPAAPAAPAAPAPPSQPDAR
ncbi:MAG: hypothetical protein ACREIA_16195 [Opitutaceae bacterium]